MDLMFTVIDHTTRVSVKSLFIGFVQKLMEINGCLELKENVSQIVKLKW